MQKQKNNQSSGRSLALRLQKHYFDLSYVLGFAEWDVQKPQPDLIRLVSDQIIQGPRILDIGCGSGDNAIYLAEQGFQVTGIDYAAKGIETAKSRAARTKSRADFFVADAFDLNQFKEPFDTIIDYGLYHNLPMNTLQHYLESISKVLRPYGQLIIQSFGEHAPKSRFGPRRVTEHELREVFTDPWLIEEIRTASYHSQAAKRIPSLLAIIKLNQN